MANILTVRLENFQSHLDTYIEFNKGLNVIVGQSDSGKTAILRGIRWALYNQPRGTDFIRVGADFVRVTVAFDHGRTIIRERTHSKNRYTIRDESGEDLVLEGFGVHVPVEVLEAHGMNHLRIDQETELMIHLSQQLDGPFLLEQTSSARAKTLGRISGAHFLDMAIRETAKDLSQINQRLKQEQESIDSLKEQLVPYEPLDEMKNQLDQTEKKIQEIKLLERKKSTLRQIKARYERVIEETEKTKQERELVNDLDIWASHVERLQNLITRHTAVKRIDFHYKENNYAVKQCVNWIKKTEHVNLAMEQQRTTQEKLELYYKLKKLSDHQRQVKQAIKVEKQHVLKGEFVDQIPTNQFEIVLKKQRNVQRLTSVNDQYRAILHEKGSLLEFLQTAPPLIELKKRQEQIEHAIGRIEYLQKVQANLKELSKRIIDGTRYIEEQEKNQEQLEANLEAKLIEMGTCPTCGQQICKHEGR